MTDVPEQPTPRQSTERPVPEDPMVEQPAQEAPVPEDHVQKEPIDAACGNAEPVLEGFASEEPEPGQHMPEEPVAAGPVSGESAFAGPMPGEPVAAGPVSGESAFAGPMPGEPVAAGPVSGESAFAEPVPEEPIAAEPMSGESAFAEPVTGESGFETFIAEAPMAAASVSAEPAIAEPGSEKQVVSESGSAEPVPGEPVPEAAVSKAAGPPKLRDPDEDCLRLAEALVFASAEPVTPRGLARVLPDDVDSDAVLAALRTRYAGRGVELVDAGNGVMFRSALDLAPRLRKVIESPRRLPRVAMETLAIVAYHQPMTRPEIEHIRGTALSQQTLDSLLELNLIAPKGRRETPGRPTLWGTTPEFLAHFGLKDLRELPRREDLLLETAPPKATPEAIPADLQPPPDAEEKSDGS
jgi:segregation and condensation protein B